jgi:biofilm protein TabA
MIVSDLEYVQEQIMLTPSIQKAFEFLRQSSSQKLIEGRIEIDGDNVFALVQSYETTVDSPKFEYHRKYLDVHYIVEGEEIVGWAYQARLLIDFPYDENKDICLGRVPMRDTTLVRLSEGDVIILYPTDAHAPRLAAGIPSHVQKIVVKIAL